ncbi:MAG: hypothetical protein JXA36_05780 [Coriobacteriia bacterium]|nr:hypothetical protein [Coriobacteriia bacterium]
MAIRVGAPQLTTEGDEVLWSVSVSGLHGAPHDLWFRVPAVHASLLTELADPALIGLLVPAMYAGEAVTVEGVVTDELAYNVRREYEYLLDLVIPDLNVIPIQTPRVARAGVPASGVATGFSGGVDSFAVVADHLFSDVPPDMRLSHLAFFNVGSHGRGERGREIFKLRLARLQAVAGQIGLPLVSVDSNLDDFYNFHNHQQNHSPRTLAAAFLLQGGIGRYYLASGAPYPHVGARRSYDTGFSDAIALPLLTTGRFRPISHGKQYTRVEKTLLIVSLPITRTALDVCVTPLPDGRNCSRCPKCMRTQLTLEIAGCLDEYRDVFDLEAYRKKRPLYRFEVSASKDLLLREIADFARESGFRLPRVPRRLGWMVVRMLQKSRAALRRLRRVIRGETQ